MSKCKPHKYQSSWYRKRLQYEKSGKVLNDVAHVDYLIRQANRRNDISVVIELHLKHPIRPFHIIGRECRKRLEQVGFRFVPLAFDCCLPPEGMSKRKAKKLKDKILREVSKENGGSLERQDNKLKAVVDEYNRGYWDEYNPPEPSRSNYEDKGFSNNIGDIMNS